jgi:hypothetical protein
MNTTTQKQRKRYLPSRNALLIILLAFASAQGAPGNVAGKSRRAFLDQVPGFARPFRNSNGAVLNGGSSLSDGPAEDSNPALAEGDATMTSLLDNPSRQEEKSQPPALLESEEPGTWPCMDELDKTLIRISLPVIANFAIAPIVQAVDLIFLNRLGNALAVAGQAASNQVYGSVFWLTSFIPSSEYKLTK